MSETARYSPDLAEALEEDRRVFEAGNLAGIWEAVVFLSSDVDVQPFIPKWLSEALLQVLENYFQGSTEGQKWFGRWKKDQEHLERWLAVQTSRKMRELSEEALQSLPAGADRGPVGFTLMVDPSEGPGADIKRWPPSGGRPVLRNSLEQIRKETSFGEIEEGVYQFVAKRFRAGASTPGDVTAETIKKSHSRVQQDIRAGNDLRYYSGLLARRLDLPRFSFIATSPPD